MTTTTAARGTFEQLAENARSLAEDMPIIYYSALAGSVEPAGDPVGDLWDEVDNYEMHREDGDDVIVWEQHPDGIMVDVTDKMDALIEKIRRDRGHDMPEWLYDGEALAEQLEEARLDAEHVRQESWRAI